jgi:purine-binding chemotaxis protein CheW
VTTTVIDQRYCTFSLADLHLGVPVTRVQEVIRSQVRTRVPLVSPVVNGLINLRGEIVTTLDLRGRLGLPPAGADAESMNVVITADDGAISILVDEIRDVLDVGNVEMDAVPPTLTGPCRDLITGIFKLEDSLLLILDTDKLVDVSIVEDTSQIKHVNNETQPNRRHA